MSKEECEEEECEEVTRANRSEFVMPVVKPRRIVKLIIKERKRKMVKFAIGTNGTNTLIDEFFTEEQWDHLSREEVPICASWDHVEVETEEDMHAYIAAMNRCLSAAWTPNQEYEDRKENGVIVAEAEAEMKRLRKN